MRSLIRFLVFTGIGWTSFSVARAAEPRTISLSPLGPLWTRDVQTGNTEADPTVLIAGRPATRVQFSGERDWSLAPGGGPIAMVPGELLELTVPVRKRGVGRVQLSFQAIDGAGQTVDWLAGATTVADSNNDVTQAHTRWVVPAGILAVRPRMTGDGPAEVWTGRWVLLNRGRADDARRPGLALSTTIENPLLRVRFDVETATLHVIDLRNQRRWEQAPLGTDLTVTNVTQTQPDALHVNLLDNVDDHSLSADIRLVASEAEFTVTLHSEAGATLSRSVSFPQPFVTEAGTYLVIPMNEGISYPVEDDSIPEMSLITYGGHGICMGFFGAAEQTSGVAYGAIVETADDADIRITRAPPPSADASGLADVRKPVLCVAPRWESQCGRFGYDRTVRYTFFTHGGHVAIAKRYRRYAQQVGRFKTLAQKREATPAVDQLVGAVNVWCWDDKPAPIVEQMQTAGIDRILWSNAASPDQVSKLNQLNVLTSRYDIYQDVMDPAQYPRLQYVQADWPSAAWPNDLMRDSVGVPLKGWEIERKDGNGMIPCGVVCDRQAVGYAVQRIGQDLQTHPYRCRFIDTTTASPFRECYDPRHLMTRTDSRIWKMKLLDTVSNRYHLVCGSETGHDAAVPYADYFEGMLSLGPYRVPDAGRNMQAILQGVPDSINRFQLGERYRLPLWELVYHDCVVAHWYWGDYNNKLPAVWDKRDEFNALYGTAPMFMFTPEWWEQHRSRFVQSYQATAPIARACGYAEMTDHEFLTPDRSVQQTTFANGLQVTVNFGDRLYETAGGKMVRPHSVNSGDDH